MKLTSRLKNLEIKKPTVVASDAKQKLENHLQKIADRNPPSTAAEQQEARDWLATVWPEHLARIRSNAN